MNLATNYRFCNKFTTSDRVYSKVVLKIRYKKLTKAKKNARQLVQTNRQGRPKYI